MLNRQSLKCSILRNGQFVVRDIVVGTMCPMEKPDPLSFFSSNQSDSPLNLNASGWHQSLRNRYWRKSSILRCWICNMLHGNTWQVQLLIPPGLDGASFAKLDATVRRKFSTAPMSVDGVCTGQNRPDGATIAGMLLRRRCSGRVRTGTS